jgi:hypothetical protein
MRVSITSTIARSGPLSGIDECPDNTAKTEPGTCGCNVADTDTDNDGTPDFNDDDGMPDVWEIQNELNPLFNDASDDSDMDGKANLREYESVTDPNDPSSYPPRAIPWVPLLLLDE